MSSQTQIIELTENDFDAQVLDSHKPVLIDFWAPWCQPCLMLAPIIDQLAEDYGDSISVARVNIDDEPQLAVEYQVNAIPTVILFHRGKLVKKFTGVQDRSNYAAGIDRLLS